MQFTEDMQLTLETQSLMTRRLRKWDQLLTSYFDDDDKNEFQHNILFVAWMLDELERPDQYGMLIRTRSSCVQGHEWERDTLRSFMELEVESSHDELADVMKTFTRPKVVRAVVANQCHVCENSHAEVSRRCTLAEQPGDIIVINLMDYEVSSALPFYN
jgi:hypothetical protein